MASIFAVFALHPSRVFEKVATESTSHDVVELLYDEFVTIQLVDLFFALSYGTFAVQPNVEWSSVPILLCYTLLANDRLLLVGRTY